jgi:hypothetical protein
MVFNPLLDTFPTEYKGIKMNTDFRVGILLNQMFTSGKIKDEDKKLNALALLYGDDFMNLGIDVLELWDGLKWFMALGYNKGINDISSNDDNSKDDNDEEDCLVDKDGNKLIFDTDVPDSDEVIDFEFDSARIYSGFLRTYGVDLNETDMHFFKFMFMLADLDGDCSHSKVVDIRQTSLKDMDKKQRRAYIKLKRIYAVPVEIDEEAKSKLEEIGMDEDDFAMYMQF